MGADTIIDGILRIATAHKKSALERLCKETAIAESQFSEFIRACEVGALPWIHEIRYRDFIPSDLRLTPEDGRNMPNLSAGPPNKDGAKALKRVHQLLRVRRYLVGHIFYHPLYNNWQLFYFDNRDLNADNNHSKHGPHVHLINHLWPQYTCVSAWAQFTNGNPKMNSALHVRFIRDITNAPTG